jgi:hypothetical protein
MLSTLRKSWFNRHFNTIISWYALIFLTRAVVFDLGPFNTHPTILAILSNGFVLTALALVAFDLLTERRCLKTPWVGILIAFVAVLVISSLLAREYGWVENAKTILWQAVPLAIMYPLCSILKKDELIRFATRIFWMIFLVSMAASLISLIEFALQLNWYYPRTDVDVYIFQGYQSGRLYGVSMSPNDGSVLRAIALISSVFYLFFFRSTKGVKALIIIGSVCNWLYFIGTASRTGLLCLACGLMTIFIFQILRIRARQREERGRGYRPLFAWSAGIVAAVAISLFVLEPLVPVYSDWAHNEAFFEAQREGEDTGDISKDYYLAERGDIREENITSNRTYIWNDYFHAIVSDSPFFGYSPRNYLPIMMENHPETYVAQRHYEPHSGYVYLLISSGFVGVALWVFLVVLFFIGLIRHIRRFKALSLASMLALALLVVLCVYAVTSDVVFIRYRYDSCLFFILLGWFFLLFGGRVTDSVEDN